eukprot:SAG31_NODE_689_length_12806_cov_5.358857_12_plen_70_part_00
MPSLQHKMNIWMCGIVIQTAIELESFRFLSSSMAVLITVLHIYLRGPCGSGGGGGPSPCAGDPGFPVRR